MNLTSIPALQDNYIWTLNDGAGNCLIVDPSETQPVLEKVYANGWKPVAILLMHHHHDHWVVYKLCWKSFLTSRLRSTGN